MKLNHLPPLTKLTKTHSHARRSPPNIYFKKKKTGGQSINSTLQLTKMDDKLILRILQEYKIHNCEVGRVAGEAGAMASTAPGCTDRHQAWV